MNKRASTLIRQFVNKMYADEPSEIRKMYQINKRLWNDTPWKQREITRKFMENCLKLKNKDGKAI